MAKWIRMLPVFWLLVFAATMSCSGQALSPKDRPVAWAKPVQVDGVNNFYQLSDSLYRGAQPTDAGFVSLHKLGVKTIVNLRGHHSDRESMADVGLAKSFHVVEIKMDAWDVSEKELIAFLRVANDASMRPLFFHCKHGSDRTGTMAAAYRVVVEGWSREDAIAEMTTGGFGFHSIWENLPRLIEKMDVKKIRAQLAQPAANVMPNPDSRIADSSF